MAPRDSETLYYLGRIYFERGNLPLALATFKDTIQLDPTSLRAHNQLGQTYEYLGQLVQAREAYLKAIELEQQQPVNYDWPRLNLGLLRLKEGEAGEAAGYLRQALAHSPTWPLCKAKLAEALIQLGEYAEGLKELQEAAQLEPNNREIRYRFARLLSKLGRIEDAEHQYAVLKNKGNVDSP